MGQRRRRIVHYSVTTRRVLIRACCSLSCRPPAPTPNTSIMRGQSSPVLTAACCAAVTMTWHLRAARKSGACHTHTASVTMSTLPWRERRERLRSPTMEAGVYAGERYRDPVAAALSPSHSFGEPLVEQSVRGGGGSAARRLDGQAAQTTTALTPAGGNVRLQRLESAVDTIVRVLGTAENCENAPAEAPARGHLDESQVKSWKAKLAAAEAEAEAHQADAAAAWEEAMQAYAERDSLQCQLGEARALIIELRERLSLEAAAPAGPSPEIRRAVALRRSARLLHGTR